MKRPTPVFQPIAKRLSMPVYIPPVATASRDKRLIISRFDQVARSISLILASMLAISASGCALGRRVPAEQLSSASSPMGAAVEVPAHSSPVMPATASPVTPSQSTEAQQAFYPVRSGTPRPAIVSNPWPSATTATTVSHQAGCSCQAHQSTDPNRFSYHGPREFHSVYDADPACQEPRQTLVIPGLGPQYPPKPPEPSRFHPVPVRPVFDPTISR